MFNSSSDEDLPCVDVTTDRIGRYTSQHGHQSHTCQAPVVILDSPKASSSHHYVAAGSTCGSLPVILSEENGSRSPVLMCKSTEEKLKRKKQIALDKRTEKEHLQEKQKQERELKRAQERIQKIQQKKMDIAVKEVVKKSRMENRSGERVKQMVVVIDTSLFKNREFKAEFEKGVQSLEVECRVSENIEAGSVKWVRVVKERTVDERAQIVEIVREECEHDMLVTLEAHGFVGLVHHSKEVLSGRLLPAGALSLEQYVTRLCTKNPGTRITLAVEGLEAFMRGSKTRLNRQFRVACLDSATSNSADGGHVPSSGRGKEKVPSEDIFSSVSQVDCEEALVRLQLSSKCVVRTCKDGTELAEYVLNLTKALCKSHYKKDSSFSFYTNSGQGPSKKELAATDNKVSLIWKHQLMQFNNLSLDMAAAIVTTYPSPFSLLEEYKKSSNLKDAETLLKDVVIRRGVGVLSTSRKLGPVLSKRIHTMMTSSDPDLLLS